MGISDLIPFKARWRVPKGFQFVVDIEKQEC
jgi:hypothetical protein